MVDKIITIRLEFKISELGYTAFKYHAEDYIEDFLRSNYKATDFKWFPERKVSGQI